MHRAESDPLVSAAASRFWTLPDKRAWLSAAALALSYCLASVIAASSPSALAVLSAFCVPNALLMGALILAPRNRWWFYLVTLLATSWFAQQSFAVEAPIWAAVYCLINCCIALAGALTFTRVGARQPCFEDFTSAWRLVFAGAIVAPILSLASMSAVLFTLDSTLRWFAALSYASTNALAMLMIVPLMLRIAHWLRSARRWPNPGRLLEAASLAILLTSFGVVLFWLPAAGPLESVMVCILLSCLLWATLRFRIAGVCTSVMVLGAIAVSASYWQLGPFAARPLGENTLVVLIYIVAAEVPLLLLAAAIEERRDLLRAWASSDTRLRTTFGQNIVPTVFWREHLITDANDTFFKLTGYSPTQVRNGALRFDQLTRGALSSAALASLPPSERELVLQNRHSVSALFSVCPFPLEPGAGVAYLLDLSESHHATAARKQVEELHSAVLASIHDQIVVLDYRGNIIDANNASQVQRLPITPFSRLQVGDHFLKYCIDSDSNGGYNATRLAEGVADVLSGKQLRVTLDFSMPTSGVIAWFHVTIEPLRHANGGAVMIWTDITGRKQADAEARAQHEQLAHLGRVAVLGELSGAFAHELAQPLTSILGNGEAAMHLVERTGSDPGEIRSILRDIIADSVRAAEVIKRLRALLTRGEISRQPLDLNAVIRDVLELARSDLTTRQVSVSTDLDQYLPFVLGDRVQLQQVVLNLVVNACEAMAQTELSRRRILIATRFDPNTCTITCTLQDHGRGISGTDSDRIFQPFVTTKPGGLGMGLAICRSIVQAHGGRLWAGNTETGGAIFSFTAHMG